MMSLDERLDKAEEMIQKPSFRENKGLGNEVGYYIFDYPAEKELYIRERIEYIKKKSENSDDDFKVVVFDLYDIMIDILIKKGYLEKCYQFEKTKERLLTIRRWGSFIKQCSHQVIHWVHFGS